MIYILSTCSPPNPPKIRFMIRNPILRVAKINAATGVLELFIIRAIWAVADAATTERNIYSLLADHNVRQAGPPISYRAATQFTGPHSCFTALPAVV